MGSKRSSTAAVLEAPEDSFVSESTDYRPARAGSLRRGYDADDESRDAPASSRRSGGPKKGQLRLRFRGLPKTTGSRVLAGGSLLLVLGVMGAAGLVVRQYLYHSERFLLPGSGNIEFVGNQQLTRAQGLTVFAGDLDRNIFHLSLTEREADLERLPWVQHATVMRLLPNRLRVSISERTPVAFVRQGTQIGLVDATGVLLDMPADAAGNPQYSFPVLTGISGSDPLSTRRARMELYTEFMKAMSTGGDQVTESLSEVDVTDPEDVRAVVARDGSDILVHFGQENFLERYRSFEEHLPEWKQAYPKLVSADMRYNNQILLDTGTGGSAPSSAAAANAVKATGPSAADAAAAALAAAGTAAPAGNSPSARAAAGKAVAHPAVAHPLAHPVKKTPAAAHGKPKAASHAGGLTR